MGAFDLSETRQSKHRDPLLKARLDAKWIGEIVARIAALAAAQSAVNVIREKTAAAKVKPIVAKSEALRTKVVGAGRYILRKDADAQAALAEQAAMAKVDASLDRAVDVRNRAFTYADEAVDEVRAAARFAFAGDTDGRTIALFRSSYALKRGRRAKTAKEARNSSVSKPLVSATAAAPSASAPGEASSVGTPRQS